jgi:hypothetical protein
MDAWLSVKRTMTVSLKIANTFMQLHDLKVQSNQLAGHFIFGIHGAMLDSEHGAQLLRERVHIVQSHSYRLRNSDMSMKR